MQQSWYKDPKAKFQEVWHKDVWGLEKILKVELIKIPGTGLYAWAWMINVDPFQEKELNKKNQPFKGLEKHKSEAFDKAEKYLNELFSSGFLRADLDKHYWSTQKN